MTCIAAIVDMGVVYMGADSAGVAGLDVKPRRDPKIYRVGEMLIGYTSSFRMGQLLGYGLTLPAHTYGVPIERYMATDFIDAVRGVLKSGGYARKENEVESGGIFLVGYRGRLFNVSSDYQVAESLDTFDAVGCGESYALGSFHATEGAHISDPFMRLELALTAAEHFSAGVRRPFIFAQTKKEAI